MLRCNYPQSLHRCLTGPATECFFSALLLLDGKDGSVMWLVLSSDFALIASFHLRYFLRRLKKIEKSNGKCLLSMRTSNFEWEDQSKATILSLFAAQGVFFFSFINDIKFHGFALIVVGEIEHLENSIELIYIIRQSPFLFQISQSFVKL